MPHTPAQPGWTIKLFIDEACPMCGREAAFMRRLDKGRGRLATEDIAAPGFDAARYGVTYEELMASIHAQLPDGRLVTGMEVFRRAYGAVGWGWLLGWSSLPGLRWLTDRLYTVFARVRLRMAVRRGACEGDACARPRDAA